MFHALALVEIEDSCAEQFLETFLEIAFINSDLAAQFPDRDRFADMLKEDFPGAHDLLAIEFVGKKFTLKAFNIAVTDHAFQAIEQEHLGLRVDIDIFEAIGVGMIEQSLQHHRAAAANVHDLRERRRMAEMKDLFRKPVIGLAHLCELLQVEEGETEAHNVDRFPRIGAIPEKITSAVGAA